MKKLGGLVGLVAVALVLPACGGSNVEGFETGMHKSPYRGFSVEFAQHREYVPGDDLRHLDWKIFGKADRFVVKQYEEETNLRAHLFLDQSESMNYAHDGGMSKFDYAATACASLAFLIQQQADAVGLTLFDEKVARQVPPSNTRANLGNLFTALEQAQSREQKTKVGAVLHELAPLAAEWHFTHFDSPRAMNAEELKAMLGSSDVPVFCQANLTAALEATRDASPRLITGSLYLAGEVLAAFSPDHATYERSWQ